ncbi:MAG TPA: hypothetical protein HA341_05165 [Halobacteria archaeon]|nr:hypothetical protein [Halobacteria archaeon]
MYKKKITSAILIIAILVISIMSVMPVFISPLASPSALSFSKSSMNASIKIVGVTEDGEGMVSTLTVDIKPGSGRILTDTNVLTGFYTQYSLKKAVQVTSNITKFDFSSHDVIFSVHSENAEAIDGESAGAAITLALIAAINGYDIPDDITITGTINDDGTIGQVGGLFEKADAAAKSGIKLFLLPESQSNVVIYKPIYIIDCFGRSITIVKPTDVNLVEYMDKNYDMSVIEVGTIEDAIHYIL